MHPTQDKVQQHDLQVKSMFAYTCIVLAMNGVDIVRMLLHVCPLCIGSGCVPAKVKHISSIHAWAAGMSTTAK